MTATAKILFCNCAYSDVVPPETRRTVLEGLEQAHVAFETVPDLCALAAAGDKRLTEWAACENLRKTSR